MEVVVVVTVGGERFPLSTPTVQEVRDVKRWTGFVSKDEWHTALLREDADALLAAYVIAKRRRGEPVDFNGQVDFPADADAIFTDGGGRRVEPVVELNPDGSLSLDSRGNLRPVMDEEGRQLWRDAESKNVIPFEKPVKTSTTQPTPTPSGDTDIGTPNIESA